MPDDFVTRNEYESRLDKLEAKVETRLSVQDAKFDRILDKIEALSREMYNSRNSSLKFALATVISFIIGGGFAALLEYAHLYVH